MDLFYKPKHAKPNPTMVRFKNSPKWVWSEVKWYACFWKDLGIAIVKKPFEYGIKAIDMRDQIEEKLEDRWDQSNQKQTFEKYKKICYNLYIRLRNKFSS